MLSLATLKPERMGLLFSLFMGAIDVSSAVMFLFYFLHKQYGYTIKQMFWSFSLLPIIFIIFSFWIFSIPQQQKQKKAYVELKTLNEDEEEEETRETGLDSEAKEIHPTGPVPWFGNQTKALLIIQSKPFILITIWSCWYMTTKYYYMANLNEQILWVTKGDTTKTKIAIYIFSIVLPLSGLFTPITSIINEKLGSYYSVIIMAMVSLVLGISSIIPVYEVQFILIICLSFNRFFFFSTMPLLLSLMFGNIGPSTLFGFINFVSALFNFTGYLWSYIALDVMHHNFMLTNVGLTAACVIYGFYFAYVVRKWHMNPPHHL